jgi:uncharacterized membrane protein
MHHRMTHPFLVFTNEEVMTAHSYRWFSLLTLGSVLGTGLIAGVFFAFSTFVMPALARLPPAQGIAAMQSINVVVLNRWFLGVFLGAAIGCVVVSAASVFQWAEPASKLVLLGGLFFVVGTFGVTVACNVPRNEALAVLSPSSAEAADLWKTYLVDWVFWNHVRTGAGVVATACLSLALLVDRVRP